MSEQTASYDEKVITLPNGDKMKWARDNIFENYYLENIDRNNSGCGNPWNMLSESEEEFVRSGTKPADPPVPANLTRYMRTTLFTSPSEVTERMKELIGADCRAVFSVDDTRCKLLNMYYDIRTPENNRLTGNKEKYMIEDSKRSSLMNDQTELIKTVDNGDTVVIVFGGNDFQFREDYYYKVQDTYVVNTILSI